jgi:hypothetical protein
MNIQTNKLIAREFLIIVGLTLLSVLFWLSLLLRNHHFENKKEIIGKDIASTKNEIKLIEAKYEIEYDEDNIPLKYSDSTWQPPDDAILEKLNKKKFTDDGLPILENDKKDPLGILKKKKRPSGQAIDSLTVLTTKLNQQKGELGIHSLKIWNQEKLMSAVTILLLVAVSIVYPIRFLVLTVIWAIKTLRT